MTRLCDLLPPSSRPVPNTQPNPQRDEIQRQIAEYLSRGGKIKQVTSEDNAGYELKKFDYRDPDWKEKRDKATVA
jgi:hypothetical protein